MSAEGVELVLDAHAWLGEGPVWDVDRDILWWVDILAGVVHAFDPAGRPGQSFALGCEVGCVAPIVDGGLLVGATDRIAVLDPERGRLETLAAFPLAAAALRCNDGKCDPDGRFWVGRMAFDEAIAAGSLVRLERDGRLTTVLGGLTMPNGMAWPSDGGSLAYIDSARREVTRYPYDPASGALGQGSTLIALGDLDLPAGAVPDGMTVDDEDCLWVAVWGGGCVLRVSPVGTVLRRIELPVSQPSSCAFGGPDLADLYVTSAREGFSLVDDAREPHAGGLFRVRPGVRGRPPDAFRPVLGERSKQA